MQYSIDGVDVVLFKPRDRFNAPVICMGAIYLYDWYSRYAPSHLYGGTILASKIGIIPILKSTRRTAQDFFISARLVLLCASQSIE